MTYPHRDFTGRVHFDSFTSASDSELRSRGLSPDLYGADVLLRAERDAEQLRRTNQLRQQQIEVQRQRDENDRRQRELREREQERQAQARRQQKKAQVATEDDEFDSYTPTTSVYKQPKKEGFDAGAFFIEQMQMQSDALLQESGSVKRRKRDEEPKYFDFQNEAAFLPPTPRELSRMERFRVRMRPVWQWIGNNKMMSLSLASTLWLLLNYEWW